MTRLGGFGLPGIAAIVQSTEREILWGGDAGKGQVLYKNGVLSGAARDSGATPTTTLRPGLVLGKITASGMYIQYDATATDGSQVAVGILPIEVRATDFDANNADRVIPILVAGPVVATQLIGLDQYARAHLAGTMIFDDDLVGSRHPYPIAVAKTADYTILAADRGTLFTNGGAVGAVNFTLPTIARGLYFTIYCEADQTITLTSAVADTLIVHNDLAADTVALSTGSKKMGGAFTVMCNPGATKWLVLPYTWNDGTTLTQQTVTT